MRCVHLGGDIWATGGWANDVTIFDLSVERQSVEDTSQQIVGRLKGHKSSVRVMAATRNRTLVTGGHDSVLRVWDCVTMTCLMELKGHSGYVLNIELRECDDSSKFFIDTIVSSGTDGRIRIWKWIDGVLKLHIECEADGIGQIYAMAFDRDRNRIIVGGYSGLVRLLEERKPVFPAN
jgi:WD40 repeat protein